MLLVLELARVDELRRAAALRRADAVRADALLRADAARDDAERRAVVAALRVFDAAFRVVEVARLRVVDVRDPAPRTAWRACLVSVSIRFKTLFTSARVLAFFACACNCLMVARAVLSASFKRRSTCRRTSGGTRFSASRSASRPAFTARPTRPERVLLRFLVAIRNLP